MSDNKEMIGEEPVGEHGRTAQEEDEYVASWVATYKKLIEVGGMTVNSENPTIHKYEERN